ncbi:uncharacterized protein FTOL_12809 [Fusarium torulosum]|uniref:Uncharacterized protein n=1 Tax=Fusarium torulosum TaxID=33205 RepID=A0AAE8SPB5_9HYPO|nr:uncharacterized protein FTOL_12809 [Fusarium torulosum]
MTPTYINLLDLKHPEAHNNNNNNLHILFQALRKKTRIVIAAGAGIPAGSREIQAHRHEAARYIFLLGQRKNGKFNAMTQELSKTFSCASHRWEQMVAFQ